MLSNKVRPANPATFPRSYSVAIPLLSALLILTGCGAFSNTTTTPTGGSTPFAKVVFVGDSLTAGYQNGSLLDTQQPNGYANLIATQAKFSITLPLIEPPGVPPVLRLVSAGPPPVVASAAGVSAGRDNPTAQPTDLAVPGHKLHDILNYAPPVVPTSGEDLITQLVLGFPIGNTKPQVAEAVALKPSTIIVWAGNNDALVADETGMPSSMTSLASFTTDFTQLMATLKGTGANLIVANIPDVTSVPYMTPSAILITEIAAATKLSSTTVASGLGLQPGDLVNAQGLKDAEAQIKQVAQGGSLTTLPDRDVLTVAEITTVQNTIAGYNQVIQLQAGAVGATLVDTHAYFATLTTGVSVNGITANNTFLGGLFSLDGIHPTNTGYALLANQFITVLNTRFTASIPIVNVSAVATADPYFGSNIKPTGMERIPTSAAIETQHVLEQWSSPAH
ncbi:MAG: SGNH/GDSL hydrolase family protein [Acidobacteriaceae bacterium]